MSVCGTKEREAREGEGRVIGWRRWEGGVGGEMGRTWYLRRNGESTVREKYPEQFSEAAFPFPANTNKSVSKILLKSRSSQTIHKQIHAKERKMKGSKIRQTTTEGMMIKG